MYIIPIIGKISFFVLGKLQLTQSISKGWYTMKAYPVTDVTDIMVKLCLILLRILCVSLSDLSGHMRAVL